MLNLEKPVEIDDVNAVIGEANLRFDSIKESLSTEEIRALVQVIAESGEPEIAVVLGSLNENIVLSEYIVKHVNAKREVSRTKDRKTRKLQAFQTTGLSKSRRREIARKAAKTKRADPGGQKIAVKRRKKALKARKMLGLKNDSQGG